MDKLSGIMYMYQDLKMSLFSWLSDETSRTLLMKSVM